MSSNERRAAEINRLEQMLAQEKTKYVNLKQIVERDMNNLPKLRSSLSLYRRRAEFYNEKLATSNNAQQLDKVETARLQLQTNRKHLDELKKALSIFDDMEPSNEALSERVEELKKTRVSLEIVSFLDETM